MKQTEDGQMSWLRLISSNLLLFFLVVVGQVRAECNNQPLDRIVGGIRAKEGEFPFIVRYENSQRIQCAGSIIDNEHILLAAHCFFDKSGTQVRGPMTIKVGCHHRNNCFKTYEVDSFIVHGDYQQSQGRRVPQNDIALIRTRQQIQFRPGNKLYSVGPVQLATTDDVRDSYIVMGWGEQKIFDTDSDPILNKATIPIIHFDICRQNYVGVTQAIFCAGEENKDSCRGDSGGPMVTKLGGNSYLQVGITSFGYGCGNDVGGVYTRVSYFKRWIEDAKRSLDGALNHNSANVLRVDLP